MSPPEPKSTPVRTYREFNRHYHLKKRVRNRLRDHAVFAASLFCSIPRGSSWIRFPVYHHVFDDERGGFAAQIAYFKNFGEFISMDEAVTLLESREPLDGRYLCVTFDDGYRNFLPNALPILQEHGAPAIIYVPTGLITASGETGAPLAREFYPGEEKAFLEFLTWDECRLLAEAGVAIGSHTAGHVSLAGLSEAEARRELAESKAVIEKETGRRCLHFACPGGLMNTDFKRGRDPELARSAGYRSFAAMVRGSAARKPDPMMIERDLALAARGTYQLRYFFSR
ncbi:MAG TPA: polysaccharide deacetylase family protein [bacterium]|nr:polysaccharide deacetylase family protein [bacterium]